MNVSSTVVYSLETWFSWRFCTFGVIREWYYRLLRQYVPDTTIPRDLWPLYLAREIAQGVTAQKLSGAQQTEVSIFSFLCTLMQMAAAYHAGVGKLKRPKRYVLVQCTVLHLNEIATIDLEHFAPPTENQRHFFLRIFLTMPYSLHLAFEKTFHFRTFESYANVLAALLRDTNPHTHLFREYIRTFMPRAIRI